MCTHIHIMASSGFLFPFSVIAYLLSASFLLSSVSFVNASEPFALFAFGDGYYDVGNLAELDPDTQFDHHPYGSSTESREPSGRPSDGLLVLDYLAQKFGLEAVRAYQRKVYAEWKYGVSFAIIGASVDNTNKNFTLSKQLEYFEVVKKHLNQSAKFGPTKTQELLSNSIYIFSLGTHEFLKLGPLSYAALGQTADAVFEQLKNAIVSIYKSGGRKFAFQNIGPLVDMPTFKYLHNRNLSDCDVDLQSAAVLYNSFLNQKLEQWATCSRNDSQWLQGFEYSYLDFFAAVKTVICSSSINATDACCGSGSYNGHLTCGIEDEYEVCKNPSSHLWFDGVHPSSAANKQIANLFWNGGPQYARPYTLKEFKERPVSSAQAAAAAAAFTI